MTGRDYYILEWIEDDIYENPQTQKEYYNSMIELVEAGQKLAERTDVRNMWATTMHKWKD